MHLENKKVLVFGLGLHGGGVGVAKWLLAQGARVTVTDLKTRKELAPSIKAIERSRKKRSFATKSLASCHYVLGRHRKSEILSADLIVQNPGVPNDSPYLKLARHHRIPITNDTALFFEHCPWPIVGVTGTKGKTTTATLLWHILKTQSDAKRHPELVEGLSQPLLAGNLRISPLELLLSHPVIPPSKGGFASGGSLSKVEGSRESQITSYELPVTSSLIVLELSSWNLEGLSRIKQSPHVAVITNIMPDHLNRYPSMAAYINAKAQIFKYQKPQDILVLNRDNPLTRALAKRARGKVLWFSVRSNRVTTVRNPVTTANHLLGEHNLENAAAAVTAARALGVPSATITKAVATFQGVPGRQQHIATIRGVRYINDTTATTPEATIAALETLHSNDKGSTLTAKRSNLNHDGHIILIAGGGDKKLNYRQLAHAIQQHCKALILFKGTASDKLLSSLSPFGRSTVGMTSPKEAVAIPISSGLTTMRSALLVATRTAARGDIILLSPGATSFGLFQHEFDRGERFVKAVFHLKNLIF